MMRRTFSHTDGRTYSLQVIGCRVSEAWTHPKKKGGSLFVTRETDDDAVAFAAKKVKQLLRKGFLEGEPDAGIVFDTDANVIDAVTRIERSDDTLAPLEGRAHVHSRRNVSVAEWWMTSDDGRRAIVLRTVLWNSKLPEPERATMADALLDALAAHRAEIFGDEKTPVRLFPLAAPVRGMRHLVVLSPEVTNMVLVDEANRGHHTMGRSVFEAFPAHEGELTGTESVAAAEARVTGRGSLLTAHWDRPAPTL